MAGFFHLGQNKDAIFFLQSVFVADLVDLADLLPIPVHSENFKLKILYF